MTNKKQIQKLQQIKDTIISQIDLLKSHPIFGGDQKIISKKQELEEVNKKIIELKNNL